MRPRDRVVVSSLSVVWMLASAACVSGSSDPSTTHGEPKDSGVGSDTPGGDSGFPTFDTGSGVDTLGPPTDTRPPPSDTTPPPPTDTGPPVACTALIDDMEHGDGSIIACTGRIGYWYTYNDATAGGTQTPAAGGPFTPTAIPGGRGTSMHAAHTSGSGFTTWGAGMAFDLNNAGGAGAVKGVYDASAYTGLTFWAKIDSGSGAVRLNVADKDTDPSGGVCSPAAKCNDHYGSNLTLTTTWTEYTIAFSSLTQQGWGEVAPGFNAKQLMAIQFQSGPGVSFDVWIDDISFKP
jgi:hypothetical protein